MIRDWRDKRVTVMGLGRFGGGVGVTRWLVQRGARVLVTDLAPREKLAASIDAVADLPVELRLGEHREPDFRDTDLLVVNPAVPESSPHLAVARAAGVPVTTEINLFVERLAAPCLGITGSVGKSTITAMIGHVLSAALAPRRVWVGGNLGRSLLDELEHIRPDDLCVLELSSFQLQRTAWLRWSPHVAVITNVTPNHLDWHGSFAAYLDAKLNIARFQPPDAARVIYDTPAIVDALAALPPVRSVARYALDDGANAKCGVRSAECVPSLRDHTPAAFNGLRGRDGRRWTGVQLSIPGPHNLENAAAALAVADALGVAPDLAIAALRSFAGLPHRLENLGTIGGTSYINDSKSSTPEAAITALRAIDGDVLIIAGGYDKGIDLTPAAVEIARRARYAACIGVTGPRLVELVRAHVGTAELHDSLAAAIDACRRRAAPGATVLLSPACASWDMFVDYRARGEAFKRLVTTNASR